MGETARAVDADEARPTRRGRRLPRLIAVDGSAASGKSTVGRLLAARLRYPFLDTGIMYRAVTLAALEHNVGLNDSPALGRLATGLRMVVDLPPPGSGRGSRVSVDGRDVTPMLRTPAVEDAVSIVSRVPGVRRAMVKLQRQIARQRPMVIAGRDIGTVVLPDADLKVYLDASLEERARRRHREFAALRRDVSEAMVLEDLRRRDRIDSERELSPLKPARDAVIIQTDGLSQEEVVRRVIDLVKAA